MIWINVLQMGTAFWALRVATIAKKRNTFEVWIEILLVHGSCFLEMNSFLRSEKRKTTIFKACKMARFFLDLQMSFVFCDTGKQDSTCREAESVQKSLSSPNVIRGFGLVRSYLQKISFIFCSICMFDPHNQDNTTFIDA